MSASEKRGAFNIKSPSLGAEKDDNRRGSNHIIGNRYEIVDRVTKNKDSNIFSVIDTKTDEIKCLKMMSFITQNKTEIKEIIREESILSSLDCPYILKYYESFLNNETLCIITEYCDGGDLGQNIKSMKKNGDKLPEDRIIHWISQLLSACYYIHSKKILHRNIKPANIMLKNGIIKLGDFGISKALQSNEYAMSFIGTPYYMSPEVVKNEPYNSKSDIWSIGCVLYELATFQRPFVGDGVYDIFHSVVNDETPSIVNIYSKDLNKLLKKMLTKSAKERPTAGELLCEPIIADYVKNIIQKSVECAKTPTKMSALINSLAPLSEIIDDEAFGEFEDKSTLRATPKSTLRSTFKD